MTSLYVLGRQRIDADDPDFAAFLANAHAAKLRPVCACTPAGAPMYVARVGDHHVIKRMPLTGAEHHPDCGSFQPPAELSGLGDVISAIHEDTASGTTVLKLDFSLSKIGGRAGPPAQAGDTDSVETGGKRLSLRGLLHYLWEEADLNKWSPGMQGKRSWFLVRKVLLRAAEQKEAKGAPLDTAIFIPESFSVDRKDELERRRLVKLADALTPPRSGHSQKLMLLIGEVKELTTARYGQKLVVKHLPGMHFLLTDELHRRLVNRFADELALWNADESTHLIAVATFGFGQSGIAAIEELSLMIVTSCWIPVAHGAEARLVSALVRDGRRFTKGLRYNLPRTRPLASIVLTDTPDPVAMHVMPPGAPNAHREAVQELIEDSHFDAWLWNPESDPLPPLPTQADGHAAPPSNAERRDGTDRHL